MQPDYLSVIDRKQTLLSKTADYLWAHPETAFDEYQSAAYLCQVLREEGFAVEEGLAGIPTAFSGTYGAGKPVIGILGEFDALSGLSQTAGVTQQHSAGQKSGHGCGHNLLGTGSLGAALAVQEYLRQSGASGTVIYFGCPGEEGGSGKAFMARDGVFSQLDAALCWHPDTQNYVRNNRMLANCQVLFQFDGKASHAGQFPELGRSALDAVELMDVGANYLREHIVEGARIHYAITDAGGFSPNVVQPHAEVLYLIRAPHNQQVQEIYARVCDIAKGAALMTGTTASHTYIKGCSSMVLNDTMQRMLQEQMEAIGVPEITEEDLSYASALTQQALLDFPEADPQHPICDQVSPYDPTEVQRYGSTDVSDVSWVCPTAQISTATMAQGTPGHSWQMTAQGTLPLAHKMTRYAAKVLAAAAVALMEQPALLCRAKAEHRQRVGTGGYVPPIPAGVRPISMESFQK